MAVFIAPGILFQLNEHDNLEAFLRNPQSALRGALVQALAELGPDVDL
jgi:hypothetical protein